MEQTPAPTPTAPSAPPAPTTPAPPPPRRRRRRRRSAHRLRVRAMTRPRIRAAARITPAAATIERSRLPTRPEAFTDSFRMLMPALFRGNAPIASTESAPKTEGRPEDGRVSYVGKWTAFGRAVFVEAGNLSHPLIVGERESACGLGWRDDDTEDRPRAAAPCDRRGGDSRDAWARASPRPSSPPFRRRDFASRGRASSSWVDDRRHEPDRRASFGGSPTARARPPARACA